MMLSGVSKKTFADETMNPVLFSWQLSWERDRNNDIRYKGSLLFSSSAQPPLNLFLSVERNR